MTRRVLAAAVIVTLLAIDWLEFHDLLEPKTLPELLTGAVSVPIIGFMLAELFGRPRRG